MGPTHNTGSPTSRRSRRLSRATVISDVANHAGVSTATVSRVINTPELVAPSTAQRVREAMEQLDYRPNLFAKGLITRSTGVLGVVLPDFHGDFYGALLQAADAEARRAGYHLIIASDARAGSSDAAQSLPVQFLDGLIAMIPFPDQRLLRSIADLEVAAVLIDADESLEGVDHLRIDNASGATAAAQHLLSTTDASDCFHVGGPQSNYDSVDRASAFLRVIRASDTEPGDSQVRFGSFDTTWGEAWAKEVLPTRRGQRTAVFAGNDDIAIGIINAAAEIGVSVPDELRVVGFDDSRLSAAVRPALSTVRVPLSDLGTAAVGMCVERIRDPEMDRRSKVLPTELVIRGSS